MIWSQLKQEFPITRIKIKVFRLMFFQGESLKRGCGKLSTVGINLLEH
jgi:hypothetical protein